MSKRRGLLCILAFALVAGVQCQSGIGDFLPEGPRALVNYRITASGSPIANRTSKHMEVGSGHNNERSNSFTWLRYLGVEGQRIFIQSVFWWKGFVGAQFGKSFNGATVNSEASWKAAVLHLRSIGDTHGSTDFITWIKRQRSIPWNEMFDRLEKTKEDSVKYRELGNPRSILLKMKSQGMRPLVVWHVTCSNFNLASSNPLDGVYWAERWELYRWFYVGGRWLATMGVEDIEPYNEPDLNENCLTGAKFLDNYLVRSRALQNAYSDHSTQKRSRIKPVILAPTLATYKFGSYAEIAVSNLHTLFPSGYDRNWYNMDVYAYHQYNIRGRTLRDRVDGNKRQVAAVSKERPLPVAITEFSCSTAANAERKLGVDLVDLPSFASCVAGQIAHLQGAVDWFVLFKFSQTLTSRTTTGVVKTGLMFADNKQAPHDIGGSSKTAEAYRLLVRKGMGGKRMWSLYGSQGFEGSSSKIYAVSDDQAFYIYSVNARDTPAKLGFDLRQLPGVKPNSPIILTAVSSAHHGEVAGTYRLKNYVFSVEQRTYSLYMVTIPRGEYAYSTLYPVADNFVRAGGRMDENMLKANPKYLFVGTDVRGKNSLTSVSVVKFDTYKRTDQPAAGVWGFSAPRPPATKPKPPSKPPSRPPSRPPSNPPDGPPGPTTVVVPWNGGRKLQASGGISSKMIMAILSMRISESTNTEPQIITVLGFNQQWKTSDITWKRLGFLNWLKDGITVNSIADNFIKWKSAQYWEQPVVVGHVTIPPRGESAGVRVELDVTDYMKEGGRDFAFVRMFRKDQRGMGEAALKKDNPQGEVRFTSSRTALDFSPRVDIVYQP